MATPAAPSLARNFAFNLTGTVAPLVVAVVAIPLLINHFGAARFGLLALGWSLVGYFSLFDMGLGRALTQRLSTLLGEGLTGRLAPVFWTGLALMAALGAVGAVLLGAFSPALATQVLSVPPELQAEATLTFALLAAGLPVVILSTGPARQRRSPPAFRPGDLGESAARYRHLRGSAAGHAFHNGAAAGHRHRRAEPLRRADCVLSARTAGTAGVQRRAAVRCRWPPAAWQATAAGLR